MKTFYKSLVAAAILTSATYASAGQVYLDVEQNFAPDTTTPSKVCDTCTSLKDQLTIKYESSTDFFDTDGSLDLSIGDKIETDGGLDIGNIAFNNVTSLNPDQIFNLDYADNGYGTDWVLSFGFTDLVGTVVGFDGIVPLLSYTSGVIDLYITFDGTTMINYMDLIVTGSANTGTNISLFGTADFTSVDATSLNNLFHYESTPSCSAGDSFFDIWSSATCTADDLAVDFVLDQNTDPAAIVVNPAGPYPLIANITTNHDGSIRFAVPVPGTLALMGLSLVMLGGVVRKKAA